MSDGLFEELSKISDDIVAAWPDEAIHVVLDNLNTHKPRNDRWLRGIRT